MAESMGVRDHTFPPAASRPGVSQLATVGQKIKAFVLRSVFWSYERGTWQYDLILLAILAFIFLTPRSWFHDRPQLQLTDVRHVPGIVEVSHGKAGWVYQVDARLLESIEPQKRDEALQDLLRRQVKKPLTVKSSTPFYGPSGVILGYTVIAVPR